MIAYSTETLTNLYIYQQIQEAAAENYLSKEEAETIQQLKPVNLYTPNFFVKIGLGFLTFFILLSTSGLFMLIFHFDMTASVFQLFFGTLCYVALEFITHTKKHYNSGVDTLLMAATVLCFTLSGMQMLPGLYNDLLMALIVFIASMWMCIRFVDRLAALVSLAAFISLVYHLFEMAGKSSRLFLPFTFILICGVLYLFFKKKYNQKTNTFYYKPLLQCIYIASLLGFYVSGNIFIVDKLNEGVQMPFVVTILLWCWTMLLPILYVWKGIQTKDPLFIRSGMVFIAVSILTYRYYHPILPAEMAMILAGILLILLSYFFIKYLRNSRGGFIFDNKQNTSPYQNVEGFIIGQTVGHPSQSVQSDTKFGGGNFGGGGAGSDF